jgi:hypothetical protein
MARMTQLKDDYVSNKSSCLRLFDLFLGQIRVGGISNNFT